MGFCSLDEAIILRMLKDFYLMRFPFEFFFLLDAVEGPATIYRRHKVVRFFVYKNRYKSASGSE